METPKEILHEIDNANNYYLEDREMLVVPLETIKQYFESIPLESQLVVKLAEAERLLKETLTCSNNDKDERGVCCQCREAINNYLDNSKFTA